MHSTLHAQRQAGLSFQSSHVHPHLAIEASSLGSLLDAPVAGCWLGTNCTVTPGVPPLTACVPATAMTGQICAAKAKSPPTEELSHGAESLKYIPSTQMCTIWTCIHATERQPILSADAAANSTARDRRHITDLLLYGASIVKVLMGRPERGGAEARWGRGTLTGLTAGSWWSSTGIALQGALTLQRMMAQAWGPQGRQASHLGF